MLDGKPYGRVSPQIADFLIDDVEEAGVKVSTFRVSWRRSHGSGRRRARDRTADRGGAGSMTVVVRNGSRGMFWLEPLVEVETAEDASPTVPYRRERSTALFNAGFLDGKSTHYIWG